MLDKLLSPKRTAAVLESHETASVDAAPPVREAKIALALSRIESGAYDDPFVLETIVDRVGQDLSRQR